VSESTGHRHRRAASGPRLTPAPTCARNARPLADHPSRSQTIMISTSTTKTTVQICQFAVARSERRSLSAMVISPRQSACLLQCGSLHRRRYPQSDRKRSIECRVRAIDDLGVAWTAGCTCPPIIERAMVTTTQRLVARSLAFDRPAEIHTTCRRLAQGQRRTDARQRARFPAGAHRDEGGPHGASRRGVC